MRLLSQAFLVAILGFTFFGCEDKKEANLYKAQDCLNKAIPATATSCLNFISTQTSERSYVIRCSVDFLAEGIDETAIVNALTNINGDKGGDPSIAILAELSMSTTAAATNALNNCTLSGSEALTALAGFSTIATTMTDLFGLLGTNPTKEQIEAAIDTFIATPPGAGSDTQRAALGNAVLASQASLCNATNGLLKNDPACADINQAVIAAGGDAVALADLLIANLDNQSN